METETVDLYEQIDHFPVYAHVASKEIISNKVERPYFTIMIPTYKRASTLEVSVQSALGQIDEDNYEILVVNNDPDGVTGETRDLLEKLQDDRISYFVNEQNIGLCGNWNRCVDLARGEYIVMLHDDDLLSPYCLRSLREAIQANHNPGIIGVGFHNFDSDSLPEFAEPGSLSYQNVTKRSFFFGRYINIAGMTFRKDIALQIGGFADKYYPNEDTIFIYQGILCSSVIQVENILAGYRIEMNATLSGDTLQDIILLTEKTRRCIAEHEPFARRWLKLFDLEYFYQYIDGANRHWSAELDHKKLCDLASVKYKKINKLKYMLMRILEQIERRLG